ncbi:hydantoinase B/oxoprolinase family protein [Parasphingorhabdus litoris]|uniref:Hydantoinase B/oxoprolinase family protein n=1 Tax=Parasphingorhabdus litoris TaxID=394733 RepID=A0ABN1APZ2_9SPHN|nr:hydantoinase B/oxoprolinase family protein [Parasphingorhabdus litoris]
MARAKTTLKVIEHDPITIEIIQSSLRAITDEMFATMRKTAMSSIIYEVLDFGVAMMDAEGELASSGSGIPSFVGMLAPGIKSVMQKFAEPGDIKPGDVFATNIPHHGGVSHLNDVVLMQPVFSKGQIISWLANKAHWVDVGGTFPGSISVDALDIYQEGLQLPCIKVIEEGKENQSVIDILAGNSRVPDITVGDFWAGIASMRSGEKRLQALIKKYGDETVRVAIAEYIALGEVMARNGLKKLPKGVYSATEKLEDGRLVRAVVAITEDAFTVDLRGNPKQGGNALNSSKDATIVDAQMIFKAITDPQSFANAGSFRPVEVLTDEGSIFDAQYPAATSVYYETGMILFDLIWKALAPSMEQHLTAGHYGSICGTFLGGKHPDTGKEHSIVEPQLGGWGASLDSDGVNALYTGQHGETFNVPVEVAEQRNGLMIDRLSLNDAPGGEGQYIGGKGINLDYRIIGEDWWISMVYVRSKNGPWALNGGLQGSTNYINVVRKDGKEERYSSCTALRLEKGDVVQVVTANGGGYGPPRKRRQESVLSDLRNGYITAATARDIYGIEA